MSKNIEVRWLKGEGAGYTDVFPLDEFTQQRVGVEGSHLVRGPKGGKSEARYRLTVDALTARMDYLAFREFNERHGILLGEMVFVFASRARRRVKALLWNGREQASEATVVLVEADTLADAVTADQARFARQLMRPGQAQFRRVLDRAYGGRCCLTGCNVSWAIHAAHITPYRETRSHTATDGLLLRSDLHALFDVGQLAIHPTTRLAYFAPEAQSWPDYARLHAIQALRAPQAGSEDCRPTANALRARWKDFVRTHGTPRS